MSDPHEPASDDPAMTPAALAVPALGAPMVDWAQYYAALGWPVFPCRGKIPLIQDWPKTASTDPFELATWWRQYPGANIGCLCGVKFWALDIDPRAGGDTTYILLQRQHGLLPATLLSHTGGGGDHVLWLMPQGRNVINKAPLGDGIDVQGLGSQIILPPSIHPETGTTYAWDIQDGPDDIMPQEAPAWLLALVTTLHAPTQSATQSAPPPPVDTPILQGSRNKTLYTYGTGFARAGASYEMMLAALTEANKRCQPPLSTLEVERIAVSANRSQRAILVVSDAAQGGHHPGSNGTGTGTGTAPDQPQWGTQFDFNQGVSGQKLMNMMRVPPRFLVEKLVPDGLTILGAPAKSYKSYFSISLALATLGAGDWCNAFPVTDTGNVVFFGLEAPVMQLRNRIHQLRPSFNPNDFPHTITFFSGMKVLPSFRNGLKQSLEQVIERYTPRLIVIDPMSYLYRLGRQEDLASATLDLLLPVAELMFEAGVALFAPEHMRKRNKEDFTVMDQLNGSHVKPGIVHGLLMMQRSGEDIIIETTMRDAPQQELTLSLEFDNDLHKITWGYKGSSAMLAATRLDDLKTKVLKELQEHRYPKKVSELLEALELPNTERNRSSIRQILHRGEKEGLLASSRRGEFYWIGQ